MLTLNRNIGEVICISDNVRLIILGIRGDQIQIGIEAPKDVSVHREEIYKKIKDGRTPLSLPKRNRTEKTEVLSIPEPEYSEEDKALLNPEPNFCICEAEPEVVHDVSPVAVVNRKIRYWVQCLDCGNRGRPEKTRWQAVLSWNKSPLSENPEDWTLPHIDMRGMTLDEKKESLVQNRQILEEEARKLKEQGITRDDQASELNRAKLAWNIYGQSLLKLQMKSKRQEEHEERLKERAKLLTEGHIGLEIQVGGESMTSSLFSFSPPSMSFGITPNVTTQDDDKTD